MIDCPEVALVQSAESEIEKTAGFESNQKIRNAVEDYAMKVVAHYYRSLNFRVTDRHKTEPYDLECTKEGRRVYVEVKGTRTTGGQILLTSNEVKLPYRPGAIVDLCVVHSIRVADGKAIETRGGTLVQYENWRPRDHDLRPISFICELTKP